MKIRILVRILWSAGTQRIAIEQARSLRDLGHEVELIFIRKSKENHNYQQLLEGINYTVLTEENESILVPLYDSITGIFMDDRKGDGRIDYNLIRNFWHYLSDRKTDLLICHDQWGGLAGYYAHKKLGTKYAVYVHEKINSYDYVCGIVKSRLVKLVRRYENEIFKNAVAVIGVTDKVAESVSKSYPVKCYPIFPGFSKRIEERPLNFRQELVTISHWSSVKHPYLYIDLMKELSGWKLMMLGNWTSEIFREEFLKRCKKEFREERIFLRDHLTEEEKRRYLINSDAFVRFGRDEYGPGMGNVEALEHLTPVIVNDRVGIAPIIRRFELGYVVKDDDFTGIVEFLNNLKSEEFADLLFKRINNFVLENGWEKHVRELLAICSIDYNYKNTDI